MLVSSRVNAYYNAKQRKGFNLNKSMCVCVCVKLFNYIHNLLQFCWTFLNLIFLISLFFLVSTKPSCSFTISMGGLTETLISKYVRPDLIIKENFKHVNWLCGLDSSTVEKVVHYVIKNKMTCKSIP